MKVEDLIRRLKKEHPREEVVFIFGEDTGKYFVIEDFPFRHAGPAKFLDGNEKEYSASVVIGFIKENDV